MTAAGVATAVRGLSSPGELRSSGRLVEQELREAEVASHPLLLTLQTLDNLVEADRVRPSHRAAAIDRPAIAVDPDHIDVGRALRHAFFEDLRALVHHSVECAVDDLLVADLALLHA